MKKNGQNNQEEEEESIFSLFSRFVTSKGTFTFEQIDRTLFWVRVILSFGMGILFGLFKIKGFTGFLTFISIVILGIYQYVTSFIKLTDLDQNQNIWGAHFIPSLSAFVISWSFVYTLFKVK